MTAYPLLLKPPKKDIGGSLFDSDYVDDRSPAESLILSCRRDEPSLIQNGEMAGKALPEVLRLWGKAVLGEKAAGSPYFPVYIKLTDAHGEQPLHIHPDRAEMWYVVDCEPGARLVYGLNAGLTKEDFRERIQNGTLSEVCNFVTVKKGDVFFIQVGTVHAVGEGMLVAQIEQDSDMDIEPTELDMDRTADTAILRPSCTPCGEIGKVTLVPGGTCRRLASCESFTVQLLEITDAMLVGCMESFMSLYCVDGCCTLEYPDGKPLTIDKGTSVFLPSGMMAHVKAAPHSAAQLLCSRI